MKALTPARPPGVSAACDALPPAWGDATHRLRGNMSGCYSRLRRLVPTIPPDRRLSRVEILQHVIDYILELQSALETHRAMLRRRRGTPATPRTPLTALNLGQFPAASIAQKQEEAASCTPSAAEWCPES
ncbi:DNA-binding protein inhibitor ID-4-like isoform X2 [Paramormyrops kingsleyae]|uniref:DNA-binding protein inhibitor ID-4 n=2 Tax=Paramormyrops kingsleyae TaxID=1676925 RepID=A0A3B3RQU8_9TELE|nr:DNA-binding protein inhibitor ID-4-like isoform X2 [Paramormyrops kingsleyae]